MPATMSIITVSCSRRSKCVTSILSIAFSGTHTPRSGTTDGAHLQQTYVTVSYREPFGDVVYSGF